MAQQQQHKRSRTRRGGRGVALVAAASAAVLLFLFSASRVAAAAVEESSSTIAASSSSSAAPASLSSLGPVFVAEEAGDDHRVETSEEELILESGVLESLMQVSSSGEEGASSDEAVADALLQAAVEGAQAAAAASAPVCSSVESCLALCPTDNFLVAGGKTEGSIEEAVRFFFSREKRNHSRESQLNFSSASRAWGWRWSQLLFFF